MTSALKRRIERLEARDPRVLVEIEVDAEGNELEPAGVEAFMRVMQAVNRGEPAPDEAELKSKIIAARQAAKVRRIKVWRPPPPNPARLSAWLKETYREIGLIGPGQDG